MLRVPEHPQKSGWVSDAPILVYLVTCNWLLTSISMSLSVKLLNTTHQRPIFVRRNVRKPFGAEIGGQALRSLKWLQRGVPREKEMRGGTKTPHTAGTQNTNRSKAFIDIRLRPGIATPLATHCHTAHYGQTWRHPLNRKYITYRNQRRPRRTEPRHRGSAYKISWRSVQLFHRYVRGQTHRQTSRQTSWSQYSAPLPGRRKNGHKTNSLILGLVRLLRPPAMNCSWPYSSYNSQPARRRSYKLIWHWKAYY